MSASFESPSIYHACYTHSGASATIVGVREALFSEGIGRWGSHFSTHRLEFIINVETSWAGLEWTRRRSNATSNRFQLMHARAKLTPTGVLANCCVYSLESTCHFGLKCLNCLCLDFDTLKLL